MAETYNPLRVSYDYMLSVLPDRSRTSPFSTADAVKGADFLLCGAGHRDDAPDSPEGGPRWRRLGTLAEIAKVKKWKGTISPGLRKKWGIGSDYHLSTDMAYYLHPDHLDTFYKPAQGPIRCSDGRSSENDIGLGEQYFGGTAAAALIHRIVDGDPSKGNFLEDIDDILRMHNKVGDPFGVHTDDKDYTHRTGCGAIDRVVDILKMIVSRPFQQQFQRIAEQIIPEDYDRKIASGLIGGFSEVEKRNGDYFPPGFQHGAIELHRRHANGNAVVERRTGEHKECALVINNVAGTTLDTNAFNRDTESKVQVFNYDLWGKRKLAQMLYPQDTVKQKKYIICSLMFAMASLMVLTDGSLDVLMRG